MLSYIDSLSRCSIDFDSNLEPTTLYFMKVFTTRTEMIVLSKILIFTSTQSLSTLISSNTGHREPQPGSVGAEGTEGRLWDNGPTKP